MSYDIDFHHMGLQMGQHMSYDTGYHDEFMRDMFSSPVAVSPLVFVAERS